MSTQFPLSYRTLDQLIDAARIDLRVISGEGQIEVQELIKIAQKCTYELGMQIQQTKEAVLEIEHGRAKLPADFYFLNFALLCHHYTEIVPEPWSGLQKYDQVTGPNITTCPCWTVVSSGSTSVLITNCDGTTSNMAFTSGSTQVCALSIPTTPGIIATTSAFCYNDYSSGRYVCSKPVTCGCDTLPGKICGVHNPDPWFQNKVYSLCDNTIGVRVIQHSSNSVREYREFERLYIVPSRAVSSFCLNTQFRDCANQAQLRDGFLECSVDCGRIYLNYQGTMEDSDGNLLVLDHPLINEYYEYSIKERIVSNLYINGEPDLERRLQFIQKETQRAKLEALTVAYTPDFQQVRMEGKINRVRNMEHYYTPFSRFFGAFDYISWRDRVVNGRFTE